MRHIWAKDCDYYRCIIVDGGLTVFDKSHCVKLQWRCNLRPEYLRLVSRAYVIQPKRKLMFNITSRT